MMPDKSLLVVIPAMNEAATIAAIVAKLRAQGRDVLVVDDGSTDNTADIALQQGARVMPLVNNMGAWNATQAGIRYALQHAYQNVVCMDADGQHCPDAIAGMLNYSQQQQADVVIAAFPARGGLAKKVTWTFFKRLSGLNINDLTSGFRLYRLPAMQELARTRATMLDYQDVGVLLILQNAGLRIAEMETTMQQRRDGKSRIFSSWLKILYYLWYTTLLCFSKRTPIK